MGIGSSFRRWREGKAEIAGLAWKSGWVHYHYHLGVSSNRSSPFKRYESLENICNVFSSIVFPFVHHGYNDVQNPPRIYFCFSPSTFCFPSLPLHPIQTCRIEKPGSTHPPNPLIISGVKSRRKKTGIHKKTNPLSKGDLMKRKKTCPKSNATQCYVAL